jgi:hypothetical protein
MKMELIPNHISYSLKMLRAIAERPPRLRLMRGPDFLATENISIIASVTRIRML